jgi:hypothetical protein
MLMSLQVKILVNGFWRMGKNADFGRSDRWGQGLELPAVASVSLWFGGARRRRSRSDLDFCVVLSGETPRSPYGPGVHKALWGTATAAVRQYSQLAGTGPEHLDLGRGSSLQVGNAAGDLRRAPVWLLRPAFEASYTPLGGRLAHGAPRYFHALRDGFVAFRQTLDSFIYCHISGWKRASSSKAAYSFQVARLLVSRRVASKSHSRKLAAFFSTFV